MTNLDYEKRDTARAIIIDGDKILLIERHRNGLHYYSIPGGGIDLGELPEQAVMREINEEITVTIKLDHEVYILKDGDNTHHFYLCDYIAGVPHLKVNSEEAGKGADNTFKPVWVKLSDLAEIKHLFWAPVFKELLQDSKHGFPETMKVIRA